MNASSENTIANPPLERIAEMLRVDERLRIDRTIAVHPLVVTAIRGASMVVLVPAPVWDRDRSLLRPFAKRLAEGSAVVVLIGEPEKVDAEQAANRGIVSIIDSDITAERLYLTVYQAFELLDAKVSAESQGKWVSRYRYELGELVGIARAMTTERDVNKLLGLILERSRYVTGADAGSIYVVETEGADAILRFKLTQNDSVSFDSREFTMPISNRSIAGSAALSRQPINIADVYALPAGSPFSFDKSFDAKIGYRTRSMLVVPLISQRDEVIGVIQLINKKLDPRRKLLTAEDVQEQVIPFDPRSEELVGMLAAQAAVSLETAMLYEEIQRLFEGFVRASVEAIESRDPTTSGHSRRVADLTVGLAETVDRVTDGPYRDVTFTKGSIRELEYASLLHDFGKIGVREQVLVKAKKLYEERLVLIRQRFDYVAKTVEVDVLRRKLDALERAAERAQLEELDQELSRRLDELEGAFGAILSANEPTVLSGGDFDRIHAIAKETYVDLRGDVHPLLDSDDVISLCVKRGSLTPEEFDEIRSHVSHSYRFLSRIPWGKSLARVPKIAGAHHERLNGTGYPDRLRAEEIPVQSKMMSIADIFDALTASDRPYKKAVPIEKALDILGFGVRDGHLDGELVKMFTEAKIWVP